jgi:hypothetical protein
MPPTTSSIMMPLALNAMARKRFKEKMRSQANSNLLLFAKQRSAIFS